jgi:hypothetical protein
MNAAAWPTPEELEAQQSPFDTAGTYPYDYRIVIVEQVNDDTYEEQLRTYRIETCLDPEGTDHSGEFEKEVGSTYRIAKEGEEADMTVVNETVVEPIRLVKVQ